MILLAVLVLAGLCLSYLGLCALVVWEDTRDANRRTFSDDDIDAITDAVAQGS